MKNSFSLLEIIISIAISSVIIIYSMSYIKQINHNNYKIQEEELKKINLLATKIFLQKNKENLVKIEFIDNSLYFDSALLLDNVDSFEIAINENYALVKIKYSDLLVQEWRF